MRAALIAPEAIPGSLCLVPGCGRQTMAAEGKGYAEHHCRYHVQHKARHGSHWHPTYLPRDYRPYVEAAARWVGDTREEHYVALTLANLESLMRNGGAAIPAHRLNGLTSKEKARVAFSRLREAGVTPERLCAIHLGVNALIEDDRGSHRVREFRIVQVAKAYHRLASGTHSEWKKHYEGRNPLGLKFDFYPKSSGLVLREIGGAAETACEFISNRAIPLVVAMKLALSGPHASHLPGWRPLWRCKLDEANAKTRLGG